MLGKRGSPFKGTRRGPLAGAVPFRSRAEGPARTDRDGGLQGPCTGSAGPQSGGAFHSYTIGNVLEARRLYEACVARLLIRKFRGDQPGPVFRDPQDWRLGKKKKISIATAQVQKPMEIVAGAQPESR